MKRFSTRHSTKLTCLLTWPITLSVKQKQIRYIVSPFDKYDRFSAKLYKMDPVLVTGSQEGK